MDLNVVEAAPVSREPFEFFTVDNVFEMGELEAVQADFPQITKPGVFPLSALAYGPSFAKLIDEIRAPRLAEILSRKFNVDLTELPLMITVRGQAQAKDGRIHTDTADKIVTCLLYLNNKWDEGGGRLRLLRSNTDIEDYVAEIPPQGGTFAAFKVAKNSWHGHKPYVGERRYIMFNWVRSDAALSRQLTRHKFSAKLKKLIPFYYAGV
jgi:hypothetical protein